MEGAAHAPTAAPEPTLALTAPITPAPTPQPVLTPAPTPTAEATRDTDPAPWPTAIRSPSPTPSPVPEPDPIAAPEGAVGAALGLREIDPAAVYVTTPRTVHPRGTGLPDDAFPPYADGPLIRVAIDAATGVVETLDGEILPDAPYPRIHDANGRIFTWDASAGPVARDGDSVVFAHCPATGDAGRIYAALGPVMEEAGAFEFPSLHGAIEIFDSEAGYLLMRDGPDLFVVDLAHGAVEPLDRFADPVRTFPAWVSGFGFPDDLEEAEVVRTDDGFALVVPPVADRWSRPGIIEARLLRYSWPQTFLSDVTVGFEAGPEYAMVGNLSETGWRLSPDGRFLAVTSLVRGAYRGSYLPALAAVSVLDAGTGEEVMRIGGATFPTRSQGRLPILHSGVWLADSSGLVVATLQGRRIATLDGTWLPIPQWLSAGLLLPSPDDPTLVLHDMTTIVDASGAIRVSLTGESPIPYYAGPFWLKAQWGATSRELVLGAVTSGREWVPTYPVMHPAIQLPPFTDTIGAELVADICLHAEPHAEATVTACLDEGSAVEIVRDSFRREVVWETCRGRRFRACEWVHVIAEDGSRGWADAQSLRWHGEPILAETAAPAAESSAATGMPTDGGGGKTVQPSEGSAVWYQAEPVIYSSGIINACAR